MRAYITKYALTQGIFAVDAGLCSESMIEYNYGSSRCNQYAHKGDFHFELDAAMEKAEQMRVKKIASLKAQTVKLENMVFEVTE